MKRILLILFLLPLIAIAQETPPSGLKAVNSQFYINLADSSIWHFKGTPYNWERVARYKDITKLKAYSDSVSNTKISNTGGNVTGLITYVSSTGSSGTLWNNIGTGDFAYDFSYGTNESDTRRIFRLGNDLTDQTYWVFQKSAGFNIGDASTDILKFNQSFFQYNSFDVWHKGNLDTSVFARKTGVVSGVSSFNGRAGAVTPSATDYVAFYVPVARNINTGFGLLGGGNLSADRTFATDTNLIVSKQYLVNYVGPTPTLQKVSASGNSFTGRLSTQGNDNTVYSNYLNQISINVPVSGQVNLGFISGSPAWRNSLGQRRLRTNFAGDADYYLPAKAQVQLVDRDSINTLDAQNVKLTGAQTVADNKTFTGSTRFNNIVSIYNGAVLRNQFTQTGAFVSNVINAQNAEVGSVNLAAPNGTPGVILSNPTMNYRVQFRIDSVGRIAYGVLNKLGGTIRDVSFLDSVGAQTWNVYTGADFVGYVRLGTPNGGPGFAFSNASNSARAQVREISTGGLAFGANTTGAAPTDQFYMMPTGRFGILNQPTSFLDAPASTTTASSLRIRTGVAPTTPNSGDFWYIGSRLHHYTTVDNTVAYLSDVPAARVPLTVAANATMVLNADYLNTTATQYILTLPPTTGFTTDGSKIITILATGTGGIKISVPSGYAMTTPAGAATTTGTGGATITQYQKIQLIPTGTNSYHLQPLNGTITVF